MAVFCDLIIMIAEAALECREEELKQLMGDAVTTILDTLARTGPSVARDVLAARCVRVVLDGDNLDIQFPEFPFTPDRLERFISPCQRSTCDNLFDLGRRPLDDPSRSQLFTFSFGGGDVSVFYPLCRSRLIAANLGIAIM